VSTSSRTLARRTRDLGLIDRNDIASWGSDSAVILYLIYPPGGPNMDLAGRPLSWSPYFEFADSFADTNDNVWAAVDPTYVPAAHPGGIYAGYHVVNHRTPAQWAASNAIADISSNGVEVMPVKAGCVNGTDTIIWPANVPIGEYDVVVDFGNTAASTPASWSPDGQYNDSTDFLDGAVQIGYSVADDPFDPGTQLIGEASYSVDDHFNPLGGVANVVSRGHPLLTTAPGLDQWSRRVRIRSSSSSSNRRLPRLYRQLAVPAASSRRSFPAIGPLSAFVYACEGKLSDREASTKLHGPERAHLSRHRRVVDTCDLMGGPLVMNERADRLKHIEMMAHLSNPAIGLRAIESAFSAIFTGVDLSISVSGHSRDGETSVIAYLRNQAAVTPFAINSVSSIAPTDFSASPVLPAVPYFVILGAAVGDLSQLNGATLYDRAGSTVADATTKSQIYVYGANHNFFNTVWAGEFDDYADSNPTFPVRADFIPSTDQQRLGDHHVRHRSSRASRRASPASAIAASSRVHSTVANIRSCSNIERAAMISRPSPKGESSSSAMMRPTNARESP
jgi:hypothetical protein